MQKHLLSTNITYHKQILPYAPPFSENVCDFPQNRVLYGYNGLEQAFVLDAAWLEEDVRRGENASGGPALGGEATVPS